MDYDEASAFSRKGGGFLKNRLRFASGSSGASEPVNDLPVASNVATNPPITPHAMTAVGMERAKHGVTKGMSRHPGQTNMQHEDFHYTS